MTSTQKQEIEILLQLDGGPKTLITYHRDTCRWNSGRRYDRCTEDSKYVLAYEGPFCTVTTSSCKKHLKNFLKVSIWELFYTIKKEKKCQKKMPISVK